MEMFNSKPNTAGVIENYSFEMKNLPNTAYLGLFLRNPYINMNKRHEKNRYPKIKMTGFWILYLNRYEYKVIHKSQTKLCKNYKNSYRGTLQKNTLLHRHKDLVEYNVLDQLKSSKQSKDTLKIKKKHCGGFDRCLFWRERRGRHLQ